MEKLNQWLTLVANLGVVAGIAFLGYGIQLNTEVMEETRKLTRADMERQLIQQFDQMTYQLFETKESASLMLRGNGGNLNDLDEEEQMMFFGRFIVQLDFLCPHTA